MAQNRISDGATIEITAAGAITAGWLVKSGALHGVALNSATGSGAKVVLGLGGVWEADKIAAASTSMAVGAKAYARATGAAGRVKCLGVATGSQIGTCFVAAVTGATKAVIKLIDNAV
jgi:predicted RecA/RadA family phage recombinase